MKKLKEKNNENYDFVFKQKVVEALIFSSSEPVPYNELLKRILDKNILNKILENLEKKYSSSGVELYVINDTYAFRTSLDVSEFLNIEKIVPKPLSRAATETREELACNSTRRGRQGQPSIMQYDDRRITTRHILTKKGRDTYSEIGCRYKYSEYIS